LCRRRSRSRGSVGSKRKVGRGRQGTIRRGGFGGGSGDGRLGQSFVDGRCGAGSSSRPADRRTSQSATTGSRFGKSRFRRRRRRRRRRFFRPLGGFDWIGVGEFCATFPFRGSTFIFFDKHFVLLLFPLHDFSHVSVFWSEDGTGQSAGSDWSRPRNIRKILNLVGLLHLQGLDGGGGRGRVLHRQSGLNIWN